MSVGPDLTVTGIVLAGGRSRRFGRDKLAEPLDGRPLLVHAVERLLDVCASLVVVLAHGAPDPALGVDERVRWVRDDVADEGPLRALSAGLAASGAELAIVVGGDMPALEPPVLREMLRAARETGAVAVALSDGGDPRPLPCVLLRGPAAEATDRLLAAEDRRLRDLLGSVRTVVVDEPTWTALDPERRTLLDVDEPGDLER